MKRLRGAILGLLALTAQQAAATTAVTQWGVSALTAYGDCTLSVCDSAALGLGLWAPTPSTQAGGLNQTFASQLNVQQTHDTIILGLVDMGVTSAQVQLDNANLSVPVLQAKAASINDNGWVSALAFGIQGYQYTGATTTTLTLGAALNGTINNPGANDVTGFSVGVWLLSPDPAVVYPAPAASTLGGFVGSVLASTVIVDAWLPADVNAGGSVNLGTGGSPLGILVNPGDTFYLLAGLVASATGPNGSADAFSTLTMSFQGATNLVPTGVSAIPEPGIQAMLLVGSAFVGWQARAKRRRDLASNSAGPA